MDRPAVGMTDDRWQVFEREALVHLEALHRYARRLAAQGAEDLLQETLLRALRFFDRYQPGTNCKAWLFRIMYNQFVNEWQKRGRQGPTASLDDTEDFYLYGKLKDSPLAHEGSPEEAFFAADLSPQVLQAIEDLPEEFRSVLILCDVEELTYQEIADVLEVPVGTVRSRLNRARCRVQRRLWEYYEEHYGRRPEGTRP